jgi:hypothetical protein
LRVVACRNARVYERAAVASADDRRARSAQATRWTRPCRRRNVFVTATTVDNSGQPSEIASIVGEEMERWLRGTEGFEGFLLLAGEEKSVGLAFWTSREVAERHAVPRAEFRERMLSIAGVRIEEVVDYDLAVARLGPALVAAPET